MEQSSRSILLTLHTLRTTRTIQAASDRMLDAVVEFDCSAQSLSALQAATYRLIGTATCQIEKLDGHWKCRLALRSPPPPGGSLDAESLRLRFLDLVADENLRESISTKTEPVRNLILSLAFGSLVADKKTDAN
jgi:His-Xaa-Ser system protein HxsD